MEGKGSVHEGAYCYIVCNYAKLRTGEFYLMFVIIGFLQCFQ